MSMHALRTLRAGLTAFGAALLLTLSACGPKQRSAHITLKSSDRTITVIGRSEVASKPDIARANVGVEVMAPTVGAAMQQARTRMTELLAALKKLGIEDKDIRTSNFSIYFERTFDPRAMGEGGVEAMPAPMLAPAPPPGPAPKGAPRGSAPSAPPPAPPVMPLRPVPPQNAGVYHVNNTVEVRIRDIEKASTVLDSVVAAGANNIWGISFELDETSAVEAKARQLATEDARKRAESLAKLSGVRLGPVVAVSEVVGFSGPPMPMPMMSRAAASQGGQTPVSSGELTYATQLQVVFAIVSAPPQEPKADDE
jgi:uncharacterized protein